MSGLKKLLGSYKSMLLVVCVIVVGVLVALGKADYAQLVDFMKWGLAFVVSARGIEEGMKGLGKRKVPSIEHKFDVSAAVADAMKAINSEAISVTDTESK